MLLTRHKLLLLGLGWGALALLALGGLLVYAAYATTPLPALPPTALALAQIAAPTVAPPPTITPPAANATPTPTTTATASASATDSATATATATTSFTHSGRAEATLTPSPTPTVTTASVTLPPGAAAATGTSVTPASATAALPAASPTPTPTAAPPTATRAATSGPPTAAPSPPPMPIADFWGVNGGSLDGGASLAPFDGNLSQSPVLRGKSFYWMNQAGLRWFRNYSSDGIDYSWRFVEPAPGQYNWTVWDTLVRAAQQKDVALLASIGNSVPQWANGSPDWRTKPTDLFTDPMATTAWYQYVRHVVERYDGDGVDDMPGLTRPIKFWELWNEPDLRDPGSGAGRQFNGTVQDYARLSQVGSAAVKAADPGAQVVGPSSAQPAGNVTTAPTFLWNWPEWLAAGGLNSVDIVAYHAYFDRNTWDTGSALDQGLEALDASRGGKPVWVTEIGWAGGATNDYQDKDNNFVRSVLIYWARPFVQHYFWYDWQESETYAGSNHHGFMQTLNGDAARGSEPDPLFHPIARVAQVLARMLAGLGARPSALDVGGAARAYHLSGNGQDVWVAWQRAASGATQINLDTGGRTVRVVGLYGGAQGTFSGGALTVGPAPVYLTTQLDWASNLGTVTGRVRHASQAGQWADGVSGVTVNLSGPVNASTSTDGDGNYVFTGLPDGDYAVAVDGGTPASQPVTVAGQAPWGRTSFAVTP